MLKELNEEYYLLVIDNTKNKVLEKANMYMNKAKDYSLWSANYCKNIYYSNGLIDALQLLESEEKLNYDSMLDNWHTKVIEKADKYRDKADDYELGSQEYYSNKNYSDGLYMALSILSFEEKKANRNK